MARQTDEKDLHGQPVARAYSHYRRIDRSVDELIGLCKGVLADGLVVQAEAEFLQAWLRSNVDVLETWPANVIYHRIEVMLSDNHLDQAEETELIELLMDVTGGPADPHVKSMATTLPLDKPAPSITFENKLFCVTGRFALGPRAVVFDEIKARGGSVTNGIVQSLDYLVIGQVGSEDWMHSTHGRKIEKAIEYRDEQNISLAIVSEEHWTKHLDSVG